MAYKNYICDGLTGGGARDLDVHSISVLTQGDRAFCSVSGEKTYFVYNTSGTGAENVTIHPYTVRPNDYSTSGVWEESRQKPDDSAYSADWNGSTLAASRNAIYDEMQLRTKASNVITNNNLIRGDGGIRGVQVATPVVDDNGRMTNTSQPCCLVHPASDQINIAVSLAVAVLWGTEVFDIGNNFASNTFTAPVTGKYQINLNLYLEDVDHFATYYFASVITSNRTYYAAILTRFIQDGSHSIAWAGVVDLDANDTVSIELYQSGGSAQTDITEHSILSISLVC